MSGHTRYLHPTAHVHDPVVIMKRIETCVPLVATLTLGLGVGLDIVKHSGDLVIVKEGEDLDLYCESSSPYQWCMWTHNGCCVFWSVSHFLNRIHFRSDQFLTVGNLQTADTVVEEASPEDGGFSWIKSSTKCGLRTGEVDTRVAGNWKCHLGKIAPLNNVILISPFST